MRNAIILVPFGATFNVSTLTTLFNSLAVHRLARVLVSLKNPSLSDVVSLFVDPSVSGTAYNVRRRMQDVADPGGEAQVVITDPNLYPFIRASAQTDSPFPVVNGVTFEVRGEAETPGALDWLLRSVSGSTPG